MNYTMMIPNMIYMTVPKYPVNAPSIRCTICMCLCVHTICALQHFICKARRLCFIVHPERLCEFLHVLLSLNSFPYLIYFSHIFLSDSNRSGFVLTDDSFIGWKNNKLLLRKYLLSSTVELLYHYSSDTCFVTSFFPRCCNFTALATSCFWLFLLLLSV